MKKFNIAAALIAIASLAACGVLPSGPYRAMNSKSDVRVAKVAMKGCDVNKKDWCYNIAKGDKVIVRSMRDGNKTARVLMAGDVVVDVPVANLK